jgi:hypothetical protein
MLIALREWMRNQRLRKLPKNHIGKYITLHGLFDG